MRNNDPQLSRLAELVKILPVMHGKVTLASGKEVDFYVDMCRATLHREATPLIEHVMIDLLEKNGFPISEIDAVGGLAMEADPVASTILHAVVARRLGLNAFVVREVTKDHGMKRQTEGPEAMGKRVVVSGDTSTIGGSPLQATDALEVTGTKVVAVVVIVDRDTGAQQRIEGAGYSYFAVLHLADLSLPWSRGLHL